MPGLGSLARWAPFALSAGALLAGCGGTSMASPDPPPAKPAKAANAAKGVGVAAPQRPQSGHVTVSIDDYAYRPGTITVRAGTRITFVNHDQQPHTATFEPASLGDKVLVSRASATITVSRPGTYHYYCAFHAFMRGTVAVRPRGR
jgi:plastocyanin